MKALQEKAESAAAGQQASLTATEKRDYLNAIELLKTENQALVAKAGKSGPNPMQQQQVFRNLMRALDRAKQIIQSIEERGKLEEEVSSMAQAGQKRQRSD